LFKNLIIINIKKVLQEIFNYFDSDKTGRINSSEMEKVLEKLNVKLSKEAYDQILKEGDKDCINYIFFLLL
jgi:Ca2+-binding EF-hand superfamily protein